MSQKRRWYTSSTGKGVKMRLKGILVGLIPLFIFLSNQLGIDATKEEVLKLINDGILPAVSGILIVAGQLRAWYYRYKDRG